MRCKIIPVANLDTIAARMMGCHSLLRILSSAAECSTTPTEALDSIADLLESICRDFRADIDGAEDYKEGKQE